MVFVPVSKGFNIPWKQDRLEHVIRKLFPDQSIINNKARNTCLSIINNINQKNSFDVQDIVKNARKVSKVLSPSANSYLELDFWIAGQRLALEYQDPYHYRSHWAPLDGVQSRDSSKQLIVEDRGDTLVIVPCWWDGSVESLAATIREKRPDLLLQYASSSSEVIPSIPPTNYFQDIAIPDVGSLTLPSQVAMDVRSSTWWMTEKYGGIRVCWNWKISKMYNMYGQEVTYFFVDHLHQLPRCIFEGEIWFGREDSPQMPEDSLTSHSKVAWRLIVVDKPNLTKDSIEQRIALIYDSILPDHTYIIIAWQMRCKFEQQMREFAQNIYVSSGQGIALRCPGSEYIPGRSPYFTEFAEYPVIEALVVDVSQDGVALRLADGKEFIAKNHEKIEGGPSVGDMVRFTCTKQRDAQGLPVYARITEIISGPEENQMPMLFLEPKTSKRERRPFGYWQSGFDGEGEHNARAFLDSLARKKGLDPRTPETWYSISAKEIEEEGGKTLIARFHSVVRLVTEIYPNLEFNPTKFRARFWATPEHRRSFFEVYARNKGFDPLSPQNWYSITTEDVSSVKGGKSILWWYGFSVSKALMELFPEIGLELLKFDRARFSQWRVTENRRAFFENFAKKRNFDPLIPSNWYLVSYDEVVSEKGGSSIMNLFHSSLVAVLGDAFGFSLDSSEFRSMPKHYWRSEENRRKFFINLAAANGIDHLNPDHWYSFPSQRVTTTKHGLSVLNHYYGCSFTRALMELFPDISLKAEKFKLLPKSFWGEVENRRAFFEKFAKSNNFDPLVASEWYKYTNKDIKLTKEGSRVLHACRSSIAVALASCYPDIGIQKSLFSP